MDYLKCLPNTVGQITVIACECNAVWQLPLRWHISEPRPPKINSTCDKHRYTCCVVFGTGGCVTGEYILVSLHVRRCVRVLFHMYDCCLRACWPALHLSLLLTGWRDQMPAHAFIGFQMPTWSHTASDSEHLCTSMFAHVCVCVFVWPVLTPTQSTLCVASITAVDQRRLMAAVRQIGSSQPYLQSEAISRVCIGLCNLYIILFSTVWTYDHLLVYNNFSSLS